MSKFFQLKEETLAIRDKEVRVRELLHKERHDFIDRSAKDRFRGPAILASIGCVEPALTEDEWSEEPSEVVEEVVAAIMRLSGMVKKKDAEEKEPNARRED